jgi:hypothetical protein
MVFLHTPAVRNEQFARQYWVTRLETETCSAGLTLKSAFLDGWFVGGMKFEPWISRADFRFETIYPTRPTITLMECEFLVLFRFVSIFLSNVTDDVLSLEMAVLLKNGNESLDCGKECYCPF